MEIQTTIKIVSKRTKKILHSYPTYCFQNEESLISFVQGMLIGYNKFRKNLQAFIYIEKENGFSYTEPRLFKVIDI